MKKFQSLGRSLSKAEMKNVLGGVDYASPIDGGGGNAGYKCCWDDQPTNCSVCVQGALPECVKGASAILC